MNEALSSCTIGLLKIVMPVLFAINILGVLFKDGAPEIRQGLRSCLRVLLPREFQSHEQTSYSSRDGDDGIEQNVQEAIDSHKGAANGGSVIARGLGKELFSSSCSFLR